jgi:hypothetical protein
MLSVSLTTSKHTYVLGEKIHVKYEIENVGETPFYIPKGIEPIGNARGCVILDVRTQPGRDGIVETHNIDQTTEYWENRNIREEIRDNWLLLRPGHFYGMTTTLKFTPLKSGRYWIVAKHASGQVSEKEKALIANQDYPLLLGTHASKEIEIEVTNPPRRKR